MVHHHLSPVLSVPHKLLGLYVLYLLQDIIQVLLHDELEPNKIDQITIFSSNTVDDVGYYPRNLATMLKQVLSTPETQQSVIHRNVQSVVTPYQRISTY